MGSFSRILPRSTSSLSPTSTMKVTLVSLFLAAGALAQADFHIDTPFVSPHIT